MMSALFVALATATVIALLAWRAGALDASGAVAATAVGTVALANGWRWGAFLILWFAIASVLSRLGHERKHARTGAIVEKSERRDARQVLANGSVFAVLALLAGPWSMVESAGVVRTALAVGAVAALAAAGADTWATEIGTLGGGRPWSLRERREVPVGTSGAISTAGTLAMLAGALLLATLATMLGVAPRATWPAVAMGGVAGAVLDTLVGAWGQERRWCPACRADTEQRVHACGAPTTRRGGTAALDNDAVNLLCTLSGAAVAVLLWLAWPR